MSQFRTYSDWYQSGPLKDAPLEQRTFVPGTDRHFAAGAVHIISVVSPAGGVVEPPVPEYAAYLYLRTGPMIQAGFNRPPRWLAVSPGALLVAPPDTSCEFAADALTHVLAIVVPKAQVDEFAYETRRRVEVRREEAFRQPHLARQILQLWHELEDGAPAGRLFGDQVMRNLLGTLARRTDGRTSRPARERLSGNVLRRLREFVESSLAEDLDVPTMAAVVGSSPAHFARAFGATVGMTPFRYVMMRRLARARELLERTDRPAVDVALDVGFKTPSHFTARFRREFGVTPRAARRDAHRQWYVDAQGRRSAGRP